MLNPAFQNYNHRTTQLLYEDLIIEVIQIYGVNVLYLPRNSISRDDLLGEDLLAKFEKTYQIEAYLEESQGFDDNYIASNVGLIIDNITTFTISKRRFHQTILDRSDKPLEGDLIYYPLSNSLFEINRISNKSPFFQTGQQFIYKFDCELYTHSQDDFETGTIVDNVNIERSDNNKVINSDNVQIEQEANNLIIDNSTPDEIINKFDANNPFGEE